MKKEIYRTIDLLNGSRCDVLIARGEHISRAVAMQLIIKKYDITPFLMEQVCMIDGEHKDYKYFLGLLSDDYMKIMEVLGSVLDNLNKD